MADIKMENGQRKRKIPWSTVEEMAQELPYLFPDLSMQDFAVYQKGYIQTPKDIAFSEKREIKIHYQKMQESFLLIP